MTKLTELWQKFETHYGGTGGYQFGYSDKGTFYKFSVMDRRTGRAKIEKVDMNKSLDHYKKTWFRMMKEFTHVVSSKAE